MAAKKDLSGRRVLAVISPSEFRDEELFEPKDALEARGASVTIASTRAGQAHGMLGQVAHAERALADCAAADWDAIYVVGGMGSPRYLWEDAALRGLLRELAASGRVVAGICLSGAVLAKAGVLEGKRATVYRTDESLAALEAGGARYTGVALEVDGAAVTADGPAAAGRFGEAIGDAIVARPKQPEHVHGPGCSHDHHHHAPLDPFVRGAPKVGRNDPCPCGSGAKYKKCCGASA